MENKEIVQNIYGWDNIKEVADEVWKSGNNILFRGELIFAFKNSVLKNDLYQVIVTRNPIGDNMMNINPNLPDNTFGVYLVTTGYSMLLPKVPYEYIESILFEDLEKFKIDKKILANFKQIMKDIKDNEL